jgi:hypothetical protein
MIVGIRFFKWATVTAQEPISTLTISVREIKATAGPSPLIACLGRYSGAKESSCLEKLPDPLPEYFPAFEITWLF